MRELFREKELFQGLAIYGIAIYELTQRILKGLFVCCLSFLVNMNQIHLLYWLSLLFFFHSH